MGVELRYHDGSRIRTKEFPECNHFVCSSNGPLIKIQNRDIDSSTVFAVHEDKVYSMKQV